MDEEQEHQEGEKDVPVQPIEGERDVPVEPIEHVEMGADGNGYFSSSSRFCHSQSPLPLSHAYLSLLFRTSSPPLPEIAGPRHYVDDDTSSDSDDHMTEGQPEKEEEYEERNDEVSEQGVSVEPLENVQLERSEWKEVCFAVLFDFLLAQSILCDNDREMWILIRS
jgi:hypothetical protein